MTEHRVSVTFVRMAFPSAQFPAFRHYALTHNPRYHPIPCPYGPDRKLYGAAVIRAVS